MSKLLFIIWQTVCNIACFVLVGIGVDFAKTGDYREWMFIVGVVVVFIPAIIEFCVWYWKGLIRSCINDKNRD